MMKKKIWTIVVLMLIVGMFPLASQAAPLKKLSWRAEYYDNNSLSGQPKLVRFEDTLDQDWGHGSPSVDIPDDNFSARWTRTQHFEKGTYLFFLTVDDGVRVWLDGALIIDAWSIGLKDRMTTKVYIDQTGDHNLQVAYFERTGKALIRFEWLQLGGEDDIVGAWQGEYFINRDLSGNPVLVRQDGAINFDWNSGSPDPKVTRDNFSVRWTRSIYLRAGDYRLQIQHDDGMRVFVNDENVYDSWHDQLVTYQTTEITVEDGYHAFRVEYYDHLGNAIAVMKIDGDPGNYEDGNGDSGNGDSTDVVIVDNKDSGFHWGGPLSSRFASAGGYSTGFYWTYNTYSEPVNSGKWTPNLRAGDYEVFAYVPGIKATTRAARYRILHSGTRSDRVVNQARFHNDWVSLGTYNFSDNGNEFVALYDNTSETGGSTQIAFDAIKFVKR